MTGAASSSNETIIVYETQFLNTIGDGNCAFYAYAMGLIDNIQDKEKPEKRVIFERWVELDPSLKVSYDELVEFDLNNSRQHKELLLRLQQSLRTITFNTKMAEIHRTCATSRVRTNFRPFVATKVYSDFAALFEGSLEADSRASNVFSKSVEILAKIKDAEAQLKKAKEDLHVDVINVDEILVPLFVDIHFGVDINAITEDTVPNPDSLITKELREIKDTTWGTEFDLGYLSSAFNINFRLYRNQQPLNIGTPSDPDLFEVRVNNVGAKLGVKATVNSGGNHWEACVYRPVLTVKQQAPAASSQAKSEPLQQEASTAVADNDSKLGELKHKVFLAVMEYCKHSESIWFSFFHRHGQTGQTRARNFHRLFAQATNYYDATTALMHFLGNNQNGNTHPHSFRTMLLQELLDEKEPLRTLSDDFTTKVYMLGEQYGAEIFAEPTFDQPAQSAGALKR